MKKQYFEKCVYDVKFESFDEIHMCKTDKCIYKENYKTEDDMCMKGGLISILEKNADDKSPYVISTK
mgnify:CR=1 FL=1|tara:strand:+ start:556 stop:756 length:201 start_codon:yes stop_codon:yes gene_type:complete